MPRIENWSLYDKALSIIRSLYGPDAEFREGQYEAIEAVMSRRRTLVVQRTGWGKSLVYFACTKLMRERNSGVTMVVSPLLVLMQNQLEAAVKLGLRCDVLNSRTKEWRGDILRNLEDGGWIWCLLHRRHCFPQMCRTIYEISALGFL